MQQKILLLSSCFLLFIGMTFAQNAWTKINQKTIEHPRERTSVPTEFQLLKLDTDIMSQQLLNAPSKSQNAAAVNVKFPNTKGTFDTYKVTEASSMHPDLQAKYPDIRSYAGFKSDDPSTKIRFTISPYFGLNAVIRNTSGMSYIDSYSKDNEVYMLYDRKDVEHTHTFACKHDGSEVIGGLELPQMSEDKTVVDGQMRKYRLAMACTIEYTSYIATEAGVGSGTDEEKKAAVMEAMNLVVTRLNEVYENDISTRLELVANNDELIFIDTDGYNPNDASQMLGVNTGIINSAIGSANYDIGHVVFRASSSQTSNGIAYLSSVCGNSKGGGVTGTEPPVGDFFVIDFIAHEMGHQFGATHTQNNSCNRTAATAVEPGSASTIMGYAGICAPNVQPHSDAYFHAVSVRQMYQHITGAAGDCSVNTATGNNEPTADAGQDRTIPKETPFVLAGLATDSDGDILTYNWEQIDTQTAPMPPRPTNAGGPAFRSILATESPERYFPRLSTIIEGYDPNINTPSNYRAWEKLPAVGRTMNFSLLVRDNNPLGGQSGRDDIRLTVTADAGPFLVTSQNVEDHVWNLGESQTITWDVANTNLAPVNTENVTILVSTDGGLTFPNTLVESTPNNGSYTFTVPSGLGTSTNARLMIKAINNVFLNVNSTNFAINSNLGVDDEVKADAFIIYPNPSKGIFTMELDTKALNVSYAVFNLEGKLITQSNIKNNGSKISQQINLSHLPSGTYLIQVINGSEKISKKLIINR